jgi:hypothetical protein
MPAFGRFSVCVVYSDLCHDHEVLPDMTQVTVTPIEGSSPPK